MGEIVHTHRYEKSKSKHADELAKERAGNTRAIRLRNEMLLARSRHELIEKRLVEQQASYLLIAFRQRMLSVPQAYARQLVGIDDTKVMAGKLRSMVLNVLNELQHLPEKVTDANWLEKLENGDGGEQA
jgi:hypothetical protein